jgi:hypothetical protein
MQCRETLHPFGLLKPEIAFNPAKPYNSQITLEMERRCRKNFFG